MDGRVCREGKGGAACRRERKQIGGVVLCDARETEGGGYSKSD